MKSREQEEFDRAVEEELEAGEDVVVAGDVDPDRYRGIYQKFEARRIDPEAQARHADCKLFVLDLDCDPHAVPAIRAYADSCEDEYPRLARDLRIRASQNKRARREEAQG